MNEANITQPQDAALQETDSGYVITPEVEGNVVDEFTTYLACGINNLWNLFSPECIILNSQLTAYLPQLLPEILQKLSPRFRATCHLKLSTLQDTGVLLGAARVCISKYLGTEKLYFSGLQP